MINIERKTAETEINLELNLYGEGKYELDTGIGFFNHMLELMAKHGFMDLKLSVNGDLDVDEHHTVEDTGIVIGQAIKRELGDCKGISRYGNLLLPMDESLIMVAIDLSGRPYYEDDLVFTRTEVGEFHVELMEEFFRSLTNNAEFNLHFKMLNGGNNHHLIEACFKGFGRALDQAIRPDNRLKGKALSTKGSLNEEGRH